jgi:hypothetical protein
MNNKYTAVNLNNAGVIMKNDKIDIEMTASVDFYSQACEVVDELNAKIKQVDDLTLMLTHALKSKLNVRECVQKLQDEGQLALTLI